MGVVWAIARLTLMSAARRRTPLVLVLVAVLVGPALSMFLEGDQRLAGLVKTVLTWNIALVSGAMMALAIFLSSNVLGRDITGKQLFMVDSKPVRRWQMIVGKWLGLALLLAWLLVLAWGATFVVVYSFSAVGRLTMWAWGGALLRWGAAAAAAAVVCWLLVRRLWGRRWWGWVAAGVVALCAVLLARDLRAIPVRHDARAADMTGVRQRMLVSRRSYKPDPPANFEAILDQRVRELQEQTRRLRDVPEEDWIVVRENLREDLEKRQWPMPYVGTAYAPTAGQTFTFRNIPVDAARYAPELVVRYMFMLRRGSEEGGNGTLFWKFASRSGALPPIGTVFKHRTADELTVPAEVILRTGEIEVTLVNNNGPTAAADGREAQPAGTMFLPRDGLEILVPVGRFDANLARGFALLWIRLAMIALVGVALNTFLSGPVTALALCAFTVVGLGNSYWINEMKPDPLMRRMGLEQSTPAERLGVAVAGAVLALAPDFNDSDPVPDLVVGREIPPSRLGWRLLADLLLRGGVVAAFGIFVFTRRELAKPTAIT